MTSTIAPRIQTISRSPVPPSSLQSPSKACRQMAIHEDDLPQRQQLPRRLRDSTRNLRALRACCPINGTPLNGAPTPLSPERRRRNRLRKEQKAKAKALARARASESSGEGKASKSREKRSKGEERSSPSDGGRSIPPFVHSPTRGPQGKYHMWSIHDPLSPAVQIDQHQPAEHRHTIPNHPPSSPRAPAGSRNHRAMSALPSPVHTQSPAEWPESQGMSAIPPSTDSAPRAHSALSAERATGWCTDSFLAAYQSYFIPSSPDNRHLDYQALAAELREHHPDTSHQAISEPASRGHSTFIRDTVGVSANNHTDHQRPRDMDLGLGASYMAQSHGGGPIVRSGPPAVIARIDCEPSHNAEGAANDGYAHGLGVDVQNPPLGLPATVYSEMHPVPLRLSLYSELAYDRVIPPSALIGDHMFSSTNGAAPRPRTTIPAIADTPLHPHRSGDILDSHSHSAGPVYLAVPNPPQVGNNENGFAHILEECFDNVEPLSADIGSLLLEADFAERQGSLATAMSECARIALEGIARSDRLLSKMDSLLLSLGAASRQERHDTATNGF